MTRRRALRIAVAVSVMLAAATVLGCVGFWFAAIWAHGADLTHRLAGTGFLLMFLSTGTVPLALVMVAVADSEAQR